MGKELKTNAMRILDQKKIPYTVYNYEKSGAISGVDAVNSLGIEPYRAYKTLVTVGKSGKNYVFDIPVDKELDLRKAALSVNEKNVSMIKSKELLPLTGYIHGGCSPVGMKKAFQTVFDKSVLALDKVIFSGGKIGYFVEIDKDNLEKIADVTFFDITVE